MASNSEIVAALVEMGFPLDKVEKAVKCSSGGIQEAMDWILAHENTSTVKDNEVDVVMQPKSLKCEDCGKILRSELDAQAHAARSGHQNFAESTEEIRPLSAKEKVAQLKRLEEKMKEKRIAREEHEKKETKEREILRRKTGKELTEIKQKMELAEAKRMAEERKREKVEDRRARQKIKEQIARDRAEREAHTTTQQPSTTTCTVEPHKKEYTTCRLQIRLIDGTTTVQSYQVKDTLQDVITQLGSPNTRLMTTFPKKVFTEEDATKSLKDLGLVPSAVLIQTLRK